MLPRLHEVSFLLNGPLEIERMPRVPALAPLHPAVCALLADLSTALRTAPAARGYPDLATLAFFCRRAHLRTLATRHRALRQNSLGRGVSFHVAPANVPVNFAYSLVAGLLAGNACIVRVSEKASAQVDILCDVLREVLARPAHAALRGHIAIVRYGHQPELNAFFSSLCDVRILWGGDEAIAELRRAPLASRAYDVTFPDRYSASILDATAYLASDDKDGIARRFYNDTYLFDQNACSSPRLVYWLGDDDTAERAKAVFWPALARVLDAKGYPSDPKIVVDKLATLYRAAIDLGGLHWQREDDARILRVRIEALSPELPSYACAGGLFYEYTDLDVGALLPLLTRRVQTLTQFGVDVRALRDRLLTAGVAGVDRIVPVGEATSFALTWDGYDLLSQLSRRIEAR